MYEDVIGTILGDLSPGYTPGAARVNALRGNEPGSFAAGMGAPVGGASPMQQPPPPMPQPPMPQPGPQAMPPGPPRTALPQATGRPGTPTPPAPGSSPGGAPGGPGVPVPMPSNAPDPLMQEYQDLSKRQEQAFADQQRLLAPPDRKGMEEMFAKQQDAGTNKLILALAAQQAGPAFEPFQAQALKQYGESQAPMKMTGGTMTAQGFIEDPAHAQELQLKQIEARITALDQARKGNLTMQENRRLALLQEEEKRKHDQMLLAIANSKQGNSGEGMALRRQGQEWRTEDSMSKQFDAQTKDYTAEIDATRKLGQLAPGRRPTAVEQGGMIMLLNKFLDPGSVVREGEYDRIAKQQGLIDRASNIIASITRGEPLSDKLVADIRSMASLYEKAAGAKIQAVGEEYADKASRRGLDPTNVIVNPYYQHRARTGTVRITGNADYDKLPSGTMFVGPDGQPRRKP